MEKNKDKPIWTKKEEERVKKYLQSPEFAESIKKMNDEWEERDRKEQQEFAEWWKNNKDIPYMLAI